MILRLYVEKKKIFDAASRIVLDNIIKNTGLIKLSEIRIFERYDFDGIKNEEFEKLKDTVLSEPGVNNAFINYLPLTDDWSHFTALSLPNQYDCRINYIKECLAMNGTKNDCKIEVYSVFAFKGKLGETELELIKNYINPIRTQSYINVKKTEAGDTYIYNVDDFIKMNDIEIYQYRQKNHFNMSKEDMCYLRDRYKLLLRNPNNIELYCIDAYWKSIKSAEMSTVLNNIQVADDPLNIPVKITLDEYYLARKSLFADKTKPVTLNEIATIGLSILRQRGQALELEKSDTNDSSLIRTPVDVDGVVEQWLLGFKNDEYHMSPGFDCSSKVAGNLLNDQACVYQEINLKLSGDPSNILSKDKKDEHWNNCAAYIAKNRSDYFNKLGICTGQVTELYSGPDCGSLEFNAAVATVSKAGNTNQKPVGGDAVIMLGGKISEKDCAGIGFEQTGNPDVMNKILRLIKDPVCSCLIKRCRYMSYGATAALASIADGVTFYFERLFNLNDINAAEFNVATAVNAPCERVVVAVDKSNVEKFILSARSINLSADIVGAVTESPYLTLVYNSKEIFRLDRELLNSGGIINNTEVYISSPLQPVDYKSSMPEELAPLSVSKAFIANLSIPGVASQRGLCEQFDSSINAATVLSPFGGVYQMTPEEASICKIPTASGDTNTVTVISYGCTPKITENSPFHGAAFSIMECLSKIVAVGSNILNVKLSTQECFKNPGNSPSKWGKPTAALLGAFSAGTGMGVAITDNKCSIIPADDFKTPFSFVCFALAVSKANEVISASFKKVDSTILLIPMPTVTKTGMPDFDKARVIYRQFHYLSQSTKILAASVVKEGGVAAAVAKMSFGNGFGVKFATEDKNILFSPLIASIIVETKNPAAFLGMDTVVIGKTTADGRYTFENESVSVTDAIRSYTSRFESVYPTNSPINIPVGNAPFYENRIDLSPHFKIAKPRVLILVFSGSRGEADCARAFKQHGAITDIFTIDSSHPEESLAELKNRINLAQIVMIPGGDDGALAVSFAANILNNPYIEDAINTLLYRRDGLILGVSSGFNILLKAGLLTDKTYFKNGVASPALAPNPIGRHVSRFVRVRVTSVLSPWLSLCNVGDVNNVAVSHSNGRFIINEETFAMLSKNGQIATQYIDLSKSPTSRFPFNPNGSSYAIEGITSPDGRVFGKLGQSERKTPGCFINIPGKKSQIIFEAGVKYFK